MDVTDFPAQKRLLYVITKSNWGGAQRYVHDLAIAAKERGMAVSVAAGGEGELVARLRDTGIPVFPLETLGRDVALTREFAAFKELYTLFRNECPDLVHLNSSKAGLAALAARFAGVKRIVFTVHGWAWNENRPFWQKIIIALVYWCTLLLVDEVIAVSHQIKREARWMPFMQQKIVVVHNGTSDISFLSKEEARRTLLPDSTRSFWIGTIAELHPVKGLDVLIEAFEHFVADFPDSEMVVIGEGQERAALERQMQIEGTSGKSYLAGHISDAARLLPAFDLFVLPSRSEALGFVLVEAGLAGVPVIATRVGGIPEVVEDGVGGILVPVDNRPLLTEAMETLAHSPELRATYSKTLQEKVAREFSRDQMIDSTFALY